MGFHIGLFWLFRAHSGRKYFPHALACAGESMPMAILSVVRAGLLLISSIFLLVAGENLFWRSAGVFTLGLVLKTLAFDPRLANAFAKLNLSPMRAFRASAALYILAAVLAAIAAVSRLHPVFAAIVVFACVSWILLFAQALRLSRSAP